MNQDEFAELHAESILAAFYLQSPYLALELLAFLGDIETPPYILCYVFQTEPLFQLIATSLSINSLILQEHDNEDNSNCDSDQTCQLGEGQGDAEQFLSLQPMSYHPSAVHRVLLTASLRITQLSYPYSLT